MSRALTLGNSKMVVGCDRFGRVRDLYFPYVGIENHIGGHHIHRIGVWADGDFHWLGDDSWTITVTCEPEALVGRIEARNNTLALTLYFNDVVYNEKNIFVRRVRVTNESDKVRDIRVFFCHQFEVYESHTAHTAYFDPEERVIIHYRGKRFFLVNGRMDDEPFQDYTTGEFGIDGREGSHMDAVDGMLAKNPIEHGPADSVVGFGGSYEPRQERIIEYWLAAGETLGEVKGYNQYIGERSCGHLLQTTRDYWRAWVNRQQFSFHGLSDEVIDQFKKSLLITRIHADETTGAILASTDSGILQAGKDTYAYMWPRDGAFTAIALYKSGSYTTAGRFFRFCNDVMTPAGYLMHKYGADKTLGSSWHPWVRDGKPILPIQEDETALVLYALWKYYDLSKNLELIEDIYNSFIKRAADFLMDFRDPETNLPKPSYDLWEEKYGVHTFTTASVSAALGAASNFAELLGKKDAAHAYRDAAEEVKQALLKYLYNADTGRFYKMIFPQEDGNTNIDETLDMSSVYALYTFDILPVNDERVSRAIADVEKTLKLDTPTGGVVRYEGDGYHRVSTDTPGNPWFITTLWLAQYYIKTARREEDLGRVKDCLQWVSAHALPSGVLSEQLHPYNGEQVSVGPLTWSHAEYIVTVINYLDKLEELGVCLACNPVQ